MTDTTSPAAESVTLTGDGIEVTLDCSRGPRVTSLLADGTQLMAELSPPVYAEASTGPRIELTGGHRLWVAPEVPELTYGFDDLTGGLVRDGDAVVVEDADTPLARRVRATLAGRTVLLQHTVTVAGGPSVRIAPWALSQLRPGGTVVLPVSRSDRDDHGLQASGSVITWPYTDLADERYSFTGDAVVVDSTLDDRPPTKIGVDGLAGWAAYVLDDIVLVMRWMPPAPDAALADLGAVAQTYIAPRFVELECLGAVRAVEPGGRADLAVRWTIHRGGGSGDGVDVAQVRALAERSPTPAQPQPDIGS